MSVSAAQAEAFYEEVLSQGTVWTIRDALGVPAPETPEGRAMPFWSQRTRAVKVIETVPAFASFETQEIPLAEWRERWLPGLERDGLRAGLNWSGERAMGFDLPPGDVEGNLAARGA